LPNDESWIPETPPSPPPAAELEPSLSPLQVMSEEVRTWAVAAIAGRPRGLPIQITAGCIRLSVAGERLTVFEVDSLRTGSEWADVLSPPDMIAGAALLIAAAECDQAEAARIVAERGTTEEQF